MVTVTLSCLAGLASMLQPSMAAAKTCGQIPEVLIVLDRSGSMKEQISGQTKWSIAKGAVGSLAQQFGSQLALGLALYPRWPVVTACTTGKVNVTPAVGSSAAIGAALGSVYPEGNTPIAATLDAASAYLAGHASMPRYVIFVGDGKETCLSPAAPLNAGGSCAWESGTNYRKCGGCGWQFCLPSGTWSSACEAKPDLFTCMTGQTCSTSTALCAGTATGSATAKLAAAKLAAQGVQTYVVGFGAQVNAQVLSDLAAAGGTGSYFKAEDPAGLTTALQQIAASISCCGNGALDAGESCDSQIPAGQAGSCDASCDDGDACTLDTRGGASADCTAKCQHSPITSAKNGDGCCPTGATSLTDNDCAPSCGNGVLDAGETCDPQIAAGQTGACDPSCDDGDPCTKGALGGSACSPSCVQTPIGADLGAKDQCCPGAQLSSLDDPDCLPPCSPDHTTDCVDLCATTTCPDGQHCVFGACEDWPAPPPLPPAADASGCDCRVAPGASSSAGLLLLLAAVLAICLARRRRAE
jgi:MYXO-CTERM domain-containing protein